MNAWAIFWNFCAVVGLLSIVGSLGWFLFTWRVTASGEHDPVESPSEVIERFTGNVRPFVPPRNGDVIGSRGTGLPVGSVIPSDAVVDIRFTSDTKPFDAGSTTLGHALGVVVVLGGLLLLLGVAGAIEGGAW